MYGIVNCGGGGMPIPRATIAVTTEDFIGETVTCVGTNYDKSYVFSELGTANFIVKALGAYTVTCGTTSATVNVTEFDVIYDIVLSSAIEITFTVEGAKEDNIQIIDPTDNSIVNNVIFPTGATSAEVTMIISDGKEYTFKSSVAKALDGSGADYEKVVPLFSNQTSGGYSINNLCRKAYKNYSTLESIPFEELRRIMRKHASADYFVEWYTHDATMLAQFTSNENAMKAIGLSDYLCDKLFEIANAKSSLLASEYWEYILKDKVPTMTSNTAPSGVASASSEYNATTHGAYKALDGVDSLQWSNSSANQSLSSVWWKYMFEKPICVNAIDIQPLGSDTSTVGKNFTYYVWASNDDTNYTKIADVAIASENIRIITHKKFDNSNYYNYYKITFSDYSTSSNYCTIGTVQFYGRALNVSVPTMTSNTTPSGVASASSEYNETYSAYKAFSGNLNPDIRWTSANATFPQWIEYDFGKNVIIKSVGVSAYYDSGQTRLKDFTVLASDNGIGVNDECGSFTYADNGTGNIGTYQVFNLTSFKSSRKWRFRVDSTYYGGVSILSLNFFGVDYSEPADVSVMPDSPYWSGNEVVAFGSYPINFANPTSPDALYAPTLTKNSNSFTATQGSGKTSGDNYGSIIFNDLFDFSGISKVYIRCEASISTTSASWSRVRAVISNNKSQPLDYVKIEAIVDGQGTQKSFNGTFELDVSDITSGYLAIHLSGRSSAITQITVKDIWFK